MHALLRLCTLAWCCLFINACSKSLAPDQSLEVAAAGLHSAALSQDGTLAVIGSIYHGGSFWLLGSEERKYNWNHSSSEPSTFISASISSDGLWALTADPATLVLWETQSGEAYRFWSAPGEILDVALGPGAATALVGLSDHSAVLFDVQRGGIKQTFKHENRVRSVDLSENGELAITGSEDASVALWNTHDGKQLLRVKHEDDVQLVKLSGDGALALSVSKYDKALLWHTHNGEVLGELPLKAQHLKRGLMFTTARFSADNQYLLTGRPDQIVQLWRIPQLQEIARWKLPKRKKWKPTSAAVLALSFGKQPNTFVAVASNGFIHHLSLRSAQ